MSSYYIKSIRENLVRAYCDLQSIQANEDLNVSDLVILSQAKIINQNIHQIAEEIQEMQDPPDLSFVNSISFKVPPTPSTSLKSYNLFQNSKKPQNREKNVLKNRQSISQATLPEDTLLIAFAIYHPLKKTKTQEWLLTSNKTLEDLHNVIQCLSNYCTFNTPAGPVIFKFQDNIVKDLRVCINDLELNIGVVYNYQHRGICQHNLIVTDIRLISFQDPQDFSLYPRQIFASRSKRRICEVCEKFHAKFICVKSPVLEIPYVYICERCLEDIKSEFNEIYPYVHD